MFHVSFVLVLFVGAFQRTRITATRLYTVLCAWHRELFLNSLILSFLCVCLEHSNTCRAPCSFSREAGGGGCKRKSLSGGFIFCFVVLFDYCYKYMYKRGPVLLSIFDNVSWHVVTAQQQEAEIWWVLHFLECSQRAMCNFRRTFAGGHAWPVWLDHATWDLSCSRCELRVGVGVGAEREQQEAGERSAFRFSFVQDMVEGEM